MKLFSWKPVLFFLLLSLLSGWGQSDIVINEIHYDPEPDNEPVEYVELFNAGSADVDLSGWYFSDAFSYLFPDGSTLAAGAYLILAENLKEYDSKFGSIFVGGIKGFDQWSSGGLSNNGDDVVLRNAGREVMDRVNYGVGFPWPTGSRGGDAALDEPEGLSMELLHPSLDNDLGGSWRVASETTPGKINSVHAEPASIPPHIRQVNHSPKAPKSGEAVTVTARVTDYDGVKSVTLHYQQVKPGSYIELEDEAYETDWTDLPMKDGGTEGDETADDGLYTVIVPEELQKHRYLMRYRITVEDSSGNRLRVPYPDDGQPNFAWFIYDGVIPWEGAVEPGTTEKVTYSSELLESVPVYQLITKKQSHLDSQGIIGAKTSSYTGSDYRWFGTLVYDGDVYDHVQYRARGGVWRYAMGKNMWKFRFHAAHDFEPKDNYGDKYNSKWRRLNFSSIIQQGNFQHRGEQGLFESVGFDLFRMAGVEGPKTHYVHFRIIENSAETSLFGNQYGLDFQGLYLAIEQMDGRLLESQGLPDGNVYKMENGTGPRVDGRAINGELKNLGAYPEVENYTDVGEFKRAYEADRPGIEWYRENLDLERYYAYRSIVEAIHHYDIGNGKNYYYYHNPETGKWATLPWDLDLTWGDNMFGPGTEPFATRALAIDELNIEYQNHQRHVMNLLYNPEQTGLLIDEKAAIVYTPGEPSLVDADRAMWDYNPIMSSNKVNGSKSSPGLYYRKAATRDFPGMINVLKDYIVHRSDWMTRTLLEDGLAPSAPVVTYTGAEGFPIDGLTFETTKFSGGNIFSPQTFASLQWRIAEVTDPSAEGFTPKGKHRFEIEESWQSDEIETFEASMTMPVSAVQPGKLYRVRARMKNARGYFGDWSDPVQFTAGQTDISPYLANLTITEILYEPTPETAAERALGYEAADFEFIEIWNAGTTALDLTPIRFTKGIDFDFADGAITTLEPKAYAIVVRNAAAFKYRYGDSIPIAGEYSGRLSNGGERIKLSFGGGLAVREFEYDNNEPWPEGASEGGVSLVLAGAAEIPDLTEASVWRASAKPGGTPGAEEVFDGMPPTGSTWAQWQASAFSETELADPLVSGPEADPDGDGLSNFLEYAFGGSALAADDDLQPKVTIDDAGETRFVFHQRTGADDVRFLVQVTEQLSEWTDVGANDASVILESNEPGADGMQVATYKVTRIDQPRRFLRLSVQLK